MFSNEVSTTDLFFSNPMDHFLGKENDIRATYESGFSSSFNNTGNAKEYRSSEELFSQSDRNNSQFGINNLDYQNYISQNLMLGKGDKSRGSSAQEIKKETERNKLPSQNDCDDNQTKDIRKLLDILNVNTENICLKMDHHTKIINNLQEEISKLNEKLTSVRNTIENEIVQMNEKYKNIITKEENNQEKMHDKISENAKNVNSFISKMDDYAQQNDGKLQECVNSIKSYEATNKKQIKSLKNIFSRIETHLEKLNTSVAASMKDIQAQQEKILDQKLQSLKSNVISTPAEQYVSTSDIYPAKLSIHEDKYTTKRRCNIQNEAYNCFETPVANTHNNSECNHGQDNALMQGILTKTSSKHSTHSPTIHYMNKYENNAMCSKTSEVNSQNYTIDCFRTPTTKTNCNFELNYGKDKTMVEQIPTISSRHSIHTPLKYYIDKYENNAENNSRGNETSKVNSEVYATNSFKKPTDRTNDNLESNFGKDNETSEWVSTTHLKNSIYTPLRHYLNKYENNRGNSPFCSARSKMDSEYMTKQPCTNLKIRRKTATPKLASPIQRRPIKDVKNVYCTPLAIALTRNRPYYQNQFQRNPSNKSHGRTEGKSKVSSMMSSPGLSIYEATSLAKCPYFSS